MKHAMPFIYFFLFTILSAFFPSFLSAQPEKTSQESAVNIDLLLKQTEDLIRDETQILEDQKEILKTIQNLKIWARRS